jgi:glycerophosphoryl diester phosphodiesterase
MANLYPENTLQAYRGTVALGVDVVERTAGAPATEG